MARPGLFNIPKLKIDEFPDEEDKLEGMPEGVETSRLIDNQSTPPVKAATLGASDDFRSNAGDAQKNGIFSKIKSFFETGRDTPQTDEQGIRYPQERKRSAFENVTQVALPAIFSTLAGAGPFAGLAAGAAGTAGAREKGLEQDTERYKAEKNTEANIAYRDALNKNQQQEIGIKSEAQKSLDRARQQGLSLKDRELQIKAKAAEAKSAKTNSPQIVGKVRQYLEYMTKKQENPNLNSPPPPQPSADEMNIYKGSKAYNDDYYDKRYKVLRR